MRNYFKPSKLEAIKNLSIRQNVSLRVIDEVTGDVVQEHIGHNSATNSLLFGIAHHLIGDFVPNDGHGLNPGYAMLSNYVPRYISLGTMGLLNQLQDSHGLPAGIGDSIPSSGDEEYAALLEALRQAEHALEAAKAALAADCQYWPACDECAQCQNCATRISGKKQAVDDAEQAYWNAYDAVMSYNEEYRFVEYMKKRPGYGADGYDENENNGRKYLGLGYAYSSYDNTNQYYTGDRTTWAGILYKCIKDTPDPCGAFSSDYWERMSDTYQPSLGTTVRLELISATFPRERISFRDIVPEYQAELPETIDVVYSAMISTGALKQFRPEGQDYIFITEAGLWSKSYWEDTGENGLLAGYRIIPPNEKNWDMTIPANRDLLKRQILKVGKNQVVQVIWKIQIGTVDRFDSESNPPIQPYYSVFASIKSSDTLLDIPGAHVIIAKDINGTQIALDARTSEMLSWITTDEPKEVHLYDDVYYFIEKLPPIGYQSAEPVIFRVNGGEVTKVGRDGDVTDNVVTIFNE